MKTRNDHGEKCFIQNKNTPNAKLTIVWTDKTTLKRFRFILKHGSWILCIVKPLLVKLGLEIEKQCQCMK